MNHLHTPRHASPPQASVRVPRTACVPRCFAVLVCGALTAAVPAFCQEGARAIRVPVKTTIDSLIRDEDTDNDRKITIDDPHVAGTGRGDKRFWFTALDGAELR